MLRPNAPDLKVYLHRAPIDMRKGRNGLAALVQEVMKQDPFGPSFFIFTKFAWPRLFQEDVVELTSETPENRSSGEHCRLTVNSTIAMAVKKRHSKIQLA